MTNEGEVLGEAMRTGLDAVETALTREPYSTPEKFECWFCGNMCDYGHFEQEVMDRTVCANCSLPDQPLVKMNAFYAELCDELVALRKFQAHVSVGVKEAETQLFRDIHPPQPAKPEPDQRSAHEKMEDAIGREYPEKR